MTDLEHDGRPEHVPGEWRDLPRDHHPYRKTHTPVVKPKGLDFAALTPTCTSCGQKSSQCIDRRCPACRGETPATDPKTRTTRRAATGSVVATAYDELDDDQLEQRFTAPDDTRLGRDLAELERDDPTVAAAAASLDDAARRITTDRPAAGAEVGKPARQPATPAEQTPSHQGPNRASAQVSPGEQTRPTPTRETTVTSPPFPAYIVDIAVVMRDSENHHDDRVRAARKAVANALVGLNRELTRVGSPAAPISPPAPATGGNGSGKLARHRDDIIRRYLAGESASAIARRYDAAPQSVLPLLRRAGITIRPANTRTTNPTGATA